MKIQSIVPVELRNALARAVVTSCYGTNLVATSTRTCTRPEDSDEDAPPPWEPPLPSWYIDLDDIFQSTLNTGHCEAAMDRYSPILTAPRSGQLYAITPCTFSELFGDWNGEIGATEFGPCEGASEQTLPFTRGLMLPRWYDENEEFSLELFTAEAEMSYASGKLGLWPEP